MLPRNKTKKIILFSLIFFLFLFCETAFAKDQNIFIRFYQEHLSSVDGNRCPMVPSCSRYAAQAFEKHGPLIGWIMSCDRLVRCGRDEAGISKKIMIHHQEFIYDPLEANDFWWFEKEKKQ